MKRRTLSNRSKKTTKGKPCWANLHKEKQNGSSVDTSTNTVGVTSNYLPNNDYNLVTNVDFQVQGTSNGQEPINLPVFSSIILPSSSITTTTTTTTTTQPVVDISTTVCCCATPNKNCKV